MLLDLKDVNRRTGSFSLKASGRFHVGIHLVTGKIGSGKTTLAALITGIILPDSGEIIMDGINKKVLLMQFPEYHLTSTTVREEAGSWGGNADLVIKEAGLSGKEHEDPLMLSRGELKRLHLAAILTGNYDLLVLDEPYAGLDEEARCWVSRKLITCRNSIVIIISHDISHLPEISWIWEMEEGTLVDIGTGKEALLAWHNPPPIIRYLNEAGTTPEKFSRKALEEAVCRIRESD